MRSKPPSEPPSPAELTSSAELELPRMDLAPEAGEFLVGRLQTQHRDELDTRPMRALKLD